MRAGGARRRWAASGAVAGAGGCGAAPRSGAQAAGGAPGWSPRRGLGFGVCSGAAFALFQLVTKKRERLMSALCNCVRLWHLFLGIREDYSSPVVLNLCLTVQEAFVLIFFSLMFQ